MQTASLEQDLHWCPADAMATEHIDEISLTAHDVFVRIGALTRHLHDTLLQLSSDRGISKAVGYLPDTRARLDTVAALTGQAAERVLGNAERAKYAQKTSMDTVCALEQQWSALLGGQPDVHALRELGRETQRQLAGTQAGLKLVDNELTDIVVAQEFHDLTGQTIQRITRLALSLEAQLVALLMDASPADQRREMLYGALSAPAIFADGRCADVITSQGQVDELLEGMGF